MYNCPSKIRITQKYFLVLIVFFNLIFISEAYAQSWTRSTFYSINCPNDPNCWINNSGLDSVIYYYTEQNMASDLRTCTPSITDDSLADIQLRRTIHSAANIWNNQADGRVLIYAGTVLDNQTTCNNIINKPAIFVNWKNCKQDSNNPMVCVTDAAADAALRPGCPGVVNLTIYGSKDDGSGTSSTATCVGNPYRLNWRIGSELQEDTEELAGYNKTLLGTLVHEFGHTLGLGHSQNSTLMPVTDSVMHTAGTFAANGERRPHLWKWDRQCNYLTGGRLLEYSYVEKSSGGIWSNTKEINSPFTNKGFVSGNYIRSATNDYYVSYHVDEIKYGLIDSNGVLNFSNTANVPINAVNSYFPSTFMTPLESSYSNDKTRLTFQTHTDPPQLKYYKSSSLFSTYTEKEWKICLNNLCSDSENLESHIPLVSTYDPISNKTIYARVLTTRPPYDDNSGRIIIHPGEYSESYLRLGLTLPQANLPTSGNNWNYNGKTDFTPGLACSDVEIESFNCVLFWHDSGSLNGRFLYKYFKVVNTFGFPSISWGNGTYQYTTYNITNGISAAFAENKLYVTFIHDSNSSPYRKVKILSNDLSSQSTWSLSADINAPDIAETPTFLYKNGYEFGVIWTEIETGL